MSIRIFGPRVLLKFVPVKEKVGRIFIPNISAQLDTHRMGVIEALGDGVEQRGLKVGDTVIFQINDVMKWAQIYRRMKTGDDLLHLLESELIGRIRGKEIRPDTLEILGNYLLFEPKFRHVSTKLILPPGIKPEAIHYILKQKGALVDLPLRTDQEIIVNHGCVTTLMVQFQNRHGDTETHEFGYTLKQWVCGCVEPDEDGGVDDDTSLSETSEFSADA